MSELQETLQLVRDRVSRYRGMPLNEQNTKASLVDPVLRALGWDTEDLEEVHREYKDKSIDKPVDYALLVLRTPRLFVEAKSLGENLNDRRWANQIMGYASVAGVEWVVLTNGDEYRIYNSHAPVPVDEKLFRSVRVSDDPSRSADTLELLSKSHIESNLIHTLWTAHHIDRQVEGVVRGLFAEEPDAALVRIIRGRLPSLNPSDIRGALRRARIRIEFPDVSDTQLTVPSTPPVAPPQPDASDSTTGLSSSASQGVSLTDLIRAGLINPPLDLHKTYKGRTLTARVESDGRVSCLGDMYNSLSISAAMARKSVIGVPRGRKYPHTNGWTFWQYRDADGKLQAIDTLRKRYLKDIN